MNSDLMKLAEDLARPYVSDWIEEGLAKGLAEGEIKGEVRSILALLKSRDLEISSEVRDRITRCTDPDLLETWVCRAATVSSADEIFT